MTRRTRVLITLALIALLCGGAYVGGRHLLGFHTVRADVVAPPLAGAGFDHSLFREVLAEHGSEGGVDYGGLIQDDHALRSYVALLEITGPASAPQRFPGEDHRLAWYLNTYNALTLLGVVHHHPITSVQDVRGTVEPSDGFGFFYAQTFVIDGRSVNLYDFENEIRAFGDARIHAAIVCASSSCPDLHGVPFEAETIDEVLDDVTRRWVSQSRNVRVDEDADEIRLTAIFDWFAEDFRAHARELNTGDTVIDWIALHLSEESATELRDAVSSGYAIRYDEYDWSLNDR